MSRYDGNPNKDTCRKGRHPWPESQVFVGSVRKSGCGGCIKDREQTRGKIPSRKVRPIVWNKSTGRKYNKIGTLVEEYDFMISCGMSFHHVAMTFGILPGSLEKALQRSGRSKSNNWKA